MGSVPFDPVQAAVQRPPQQPDVLGQHHQAERQHPEPENRENAEHAAADQ
jgi:hypothetical protein